MPFGNPDWPLQKSVWDKDRWEHQYPMQYGIPAFSLNKVEPLMGWACPSCHRVYAPSVSMCWYCPQPSSDNTDNENDLE